MIDVGIALVLGIAALGAGYLGYAGKFKGAAMIVGGVVVLAALFLPGYGYWGDVITDITPDEAQVVAGGFAITPTNGSWPAASLDANTVTIHDDERGCVVQLLVEDGTGWLTHSNYTSVNFSLNPVAPLGATADDLITIHFSIDQDIKYAGEYVFYETGNDWGADWRVNGESTDDDGVGSHTMLYTDEDWVELRLRESIGANSFGSEMQTVGETVTIPVTFSTEGWSQTFDVTYIVISVN